MILMNIPSGYDQHSHGKIHQFLLGKASISMGHGFHGELLNNQRVINIYPEMVYIL